MSLDHLQFMSIICNVFQCDCCSFCVSSTHGTAILLLGVGVGSVDKVCLYGVGDSSEHGGAGRSASASGGGGGVGSAASSMTGRGSGGGARIGLKVSGAGGGGGGPARGVMSRGSPRGPGAWSVSSFKVCLVWWTVHLVLVLA